MTMIGGPAAGRGEVGETVATFPTYEAAQQAVSKLIAGDVPARAIAIVGQNLSSIERVTGRLGYATAARQGAINGLFLGLLFSAFFVFGNPNVPIQAFVGVVFVGIAVGMLLSIITYSIIRRRRDFASVTQVIAEHYNVTVLRDSLPQARRLMGGQAAAPARPPVPDDAPPADVATPPQYGERLPPAAHEPAGAGGVIGGGEAPGPDLPPDPGEVPPGPAAPPAPGEPSPVGPSPVDPGDRGR